MSTLIVGTGYVGLIQGLVLAEKSKKPVILLEKDQTKLRKLSVEKKSHFYEPGVEKLLKKNISRLQFESSLSPDFFSAENVVFICVGTPPGPDGEADLRFLQAAADEVVETVKTLKNSRTTIVIKSTVPPGTTQALADKYAAHGKQIYWAMNPEFLREGVAVEDGLHPDRIVIGTTAAPAEKMLKKTYAGFKKAQWVVCTPTEAELAKYSMNSLLALLISFSNEISQISQRLSGVNPHRILDIVKMDGRWKVGGKLPAIASYLVPGPGYGGSCFPKDVSAIVTRAAQLGTPAKILKSVIDVNQDMGLFASEKVRSLVPKKSKITLLGLAFKPDTDDIRESPTLRIVQNLQVDYDICIHDPIAELPDSLKNQVRFTRNLTEALTGSSLALVITSWNEYANLSDRHTKTMGQPLIVDTRGFLKKNKFKKTKYHLLGFNNEPAKK